jgi:6-phosphogluconolactonase (cycloisomerase 2 family)
MNLVQLWSSYGLYPRHFSLNKVGSLVAVANQHSRSVSILYRDIVTGYIDGLAQSITELGGEAMNVVWA